jgi:hypothetical protein
MRMMSLARAERILSVIFASLAVSALLLLAIYHGPLHEPAANASVAAVSDAIGSDVHPPALDTYIEVTDGCGPYFEGACVNVRSGPGENYADVGSLRSGMVLRVGEARESGGHTWYRIVFDESVRYPDRISKEWWIAGDYVRVFKHEGPKVFDEGKTASTTKRIIIDRGDQMLYAYDGDALFMEQAISSGLDGTPTPRGNFMVFNKTPSRYMQGPLPGISDQYYDLPGVPWDLYFTHEGGAIHGAYWHDKFGERWSHGCVNLPIEKAKELYEWTDLGTTVVVRD